MEELVRDVINIGLGAAEKVKQVVSGDTSGLNINIDELKEKGAANESEIAQKIRETLDTALNHVQELRDKVDTILSEGQTKLSESLSKLNLPQVNVDDLKNNFDSYVSQLQVKLDEVFEKIKPVLESANISDLKAKVEEIINKVKGGSGPA